MDSTGVLGSDLSKTLSFEGPAVLNLSARSQIAKPRDIKLKASFDAFENICNCFQTRFLIKIPSGPLQEFTRFEEA